MTELNLRRQSTHSQRIRRQGFFQIILSGALFGFLGIFGKTAYEHQILPGELLALRFLISSILLGMFLLMIRPQTLKMSGAHRATSLSLGIFGYAVFSSFYFKALQGVSASLTVLLLYTFPIIVTLGARLFFKEHIGKKGWLALFISTLGLIGLVWGDWQSSHPVYLMFGLGSALFYAAYILASRKWLCEVNPLGSSFYMQMGAAAVLFIVNFSTAARPLEILVNQPGIVFGMAVVCSVFPLTLFLAGLQKVTSSEASILSTSEPIFAILIATFLLGEKISVVQFFGGALVLSGMVLIALRKPTEAVRRAATQ